MFGAISNHFFRGRYFFCVPVYAMHQSNRLSLAKVLISLFMTILLWTLVTNAWGYTKLFFGAQGDSLITHTYNFFSRLIWAFPAIALLQRYKDKIPTTWKGLFTNKPHFKS